MEQTTMASSPGDSSAKRKAEEENKEQSDKKIKAEGEERGGKRSIDEWETLAKKIRTRRSADRKGVRTQEKMWTLAKLTLQGRLVQCQRANLTRSSTRRWSS